MEEIPWEVASVERIGIKLEASPIEPSTIISPYAGVVLWEMLFSALECSSALPPQPHMKRKVNIIKTGIIRFVCLIELYLSFLLP
jgi:hypothetical protein